MTIQLSWLTGVPALLLVGCLGAAVDDAPAGTGGMGSSGGSGESGSGALPAGGSSEVQGGAAGQAGTAQGGMPTAGGAAGTGRAGSGGDAGAAGSENEPIDITAVNPTAGCAQVAPGDLVQGVMVERHMEVSGTKDPDSTDTMIDGPWT
ncbi:MAG TPA: hypothetical protein VM686_19905, partial [Polyangiaceae bacterium]|nr:hypothetical protein [Polyangiaceae bacterium]